MILATPDDIPSNNCAVDRSQRAVCHANIIVSCINSALESSGSPFEPSAAPCWCTSIPDILRHQAASMKRASTRTNGSIANECRVSRVAPTHASRFSATTSSTVSQVSATRQSSSMLRRFSCRTRSSDWTPFHRGGEGGAESNRALSEDSSTLPPEHFRKLIVSREAQERDIRFLGCLPRYSGLSNELPSEIETANGRSR